MCELLIKAVDLNHSDPYINIAGCYKRGDVILIEEDGYTWGSSELDTTIFAIVKMQGVSRENVKYLLNSNDKPIKHSALHKIPNIFIHMNKQLREPIIRKRFSVDLITKKITDKARM